MFQIWHSVHAWLELKDEEFLYLEGAEDIDVMGPDSAQAVQVKHTRTAVTLRSEAVLQAIGSFWRLTKQSDREIQFIFLTTAQEGVEQGEPFGPGLPGLVAWRRGRSDECLAEAVRTFLISEGRLDADVAAFLKQAGPQDVQSRLLRLVVWQTGSDDSPAVEEAVKRKLIAHGDRYRVPASAAKQVVNRLLREAWEAASERGRYLSRADLLELFELETAVSVPCALVSQLLASGAILSPRPPLIGDLTLPLITTESPQVSPVPPLLGSVATRQELVTQCTAVLADRGLLVLTGSTGMGKSTIAKLIVHETGGEWAWFPLGGTEAAQAALLLRRLSEFLDSGSRKARIVIDGVEGTALSLPSVTEPLSGLIYTALAQRGRVIITSQQALLPRWFAALGISEACQLQVPRFTQTDVFELARLLGCPSEITTVPWADWILGQTQGHPQLVHARLVRLKEEGWPRPSVQELFSQPTEVAEERARARQQLLGGVSQDARELISRLSLLIGTFRRDHAIAIGEISPTIPRPGDAFDALLGPWIEVAARNYFRVSALLADAGQEVWSARQALAMRAELAGAVLRCAPRTLTEAAEALFQGLFSRASGPVLAVLGSLYHASDAVLQRVSDEMPWFLLWAVGTGTSSFPPDRKVNYLVRMLQFRIAAKARPETAAKIANTWEAECATTSEDADALQQRYLLAAELCLHHPTLSASDLISHLEEIAKVERIAGGMAEGILPAFPQFAEWATSDHVTELFRIAIHRNPSLEFLSELLAAMVEAPLELRDRLLVAFRTRPEDARLLIDATWTSEQGRDKPRWDECLKALRLVADTAQGWGLPEMAAAALASVSVILDEYLDREDEALAAITEGERRLGASRILAEQRATVALNRKHYSDALEQWNRLYPASDAGEPAGDMRSVIGARRGGEAAGCAGDWQRAAQFFLTARRHARGSSQPATAAGLLADAGFAYWKAGSGRLAFDCFYEGLRMLDAIPDPATDLRSLVALKRFGHVLLWVAKSGSHDVSELLAIPAPGMCSQPGLPGEFRKLPLTPIAGLWQLLAELEYQYGPGDEVFVEITRRLSESQPLAIAISHTELDIRRSLRDGDHTRAIDQCLRFNTLFYALWQVKEAEGDALTTRWVGTHCPDEHFSSMTLQAGLLVEAAESGQEGIQATLAAWRSEAARQPEIVAILGWLDETEPIISLAISSARAILADSEQTQPRRWAAALRLAVDDHCPPEASFYADITLMHWMERAFFKQEVAIRLAAMVTKAWSRHAATPALLRAPRLTVPEIVRECGADQPPMKKVARILSAAHQAVAGYLSDELVDLLRRNSEVPTSPA
jgi:hypothetical protein